VLKNGVPTGKFYLDFKVDFSVKKHI